jgi:hypothetical protein
VDRFGRVVLNYNAENIENAAIDIGSLPRGMYIVKLLGQSGLQTRALIRD